MAELYHYCKFVVKYHRFNSMRIANHTREQLKEAADQLLLRTPETFQRLARYSASAHVTEKESLVDMMYVDPSADSSTAPPTQMQTSKSALFRKYKSVILHWSRSTMHRAGTIVMRRKGCVHLHSNMLNLSYPLTNEAKL